MAGKNTAVFGIYPDYASVEFGVQGLKDAGFGNTDISILFPENVGNKEFAHEKATKAPEGAAAGASTGAVLGGFWDGWSGSARWPFRESDRSSPAGPIVAALAGAGAVGAVGGVAGGLIGLGMPEYEDKRYQGRIRDGGILLSVHSDSSEWTKRAKGILEQTGAQDISSTGEASADFDKSDRPVPRSAGI